MNEPLSSLLEMYTRVVHCEIFITSGSCNDLAGSLLEIEFSLCTTAECFGKWYFPADFKACTVPEVCGKWFVPGGWL